MNPILVYGLGRSGLAVCTFLKEGGHSFVAYDETLKPEERAAVEAIGGLIIDNPLEPPLSLCIAAPGVAWEHPHLVALREQGIETIGEVEWVYRSVDAGIIGVTGTAGKTTVTRWLSEVLLNAGHKAPAGGNIGPALVAVAEPGATLVTELSSFMLERCPTLKPEIAIVLNLGTDHVDRHGSLEAYHAAKRNLLKNLDSESLFIYNADDPTLRTWAQSSAAQTLSYSVTGSADAYIADGTLYLHGEALLELTELKVAGVHQHTNALPVALAADARGVPRDSLRQGLCAFRGVPGRYALVSVIGGVRFIEDSIATRTLAVKAALEATPAPVVLIGGNQDKGASFAELEAAIREKVTLFIGVGEAGSSFAQAFSGWTETCVSLEPDGKEALRWACRQGLEHLEAHHAGGGSVLLAPLGASFDQFKDYVARAAAFRQAVGELEAAWTDS